MSLPSSACLLLILTAGLAGPAAAAGLPVVSGAVQVIQPSEVQLGTMPTLALAVPDRDAVIHLECTVGEAKQTVTSEVLPPGQALEVELNATESVTTADCVLVANFANGLTERRPLTVGWTWVEGVVPEEEEAGEGEAEGTQDTLSVEEEEAASAPQDPRTAQDQGATGLLEDVETAPAPTDQTP